MRWKAVASVALGFLCAPASADAACPPPEANYAAFPADARDPLRAQQWGLDHIKVEAAWRRGLRGQGTVVAVLDTGADTAHPDLAPNLLPGADLVAGTTCPQDDAGHGTPVAGVVAAVADNAAGGSGVAPQAKILPVKANVAGKIQMSPPHLAAAIRYAVAQGADVINMSFGGYGGIAGEEPDVVAAIEDAWKQGVVLVASAGNDPYIPVCQSPAIQPHVVCVASTDSDGRPSQTSDFPGRADGGVAVRAPGGNLTAASCEDLVMAPVDPRHPPAFACPPGDGYNVVVGTSFAAPHVAGLAALMLSAGIGNEEVVSRLRDRSSNGGAYDPVWGHGLIDADRATEGLAPVRIPAAPVAPAPLPAAPAPATSGRRCADAHAKRLRAQRRHAQARRRARRKGGRRLVAKRRRELAAARRGERRACS